MNLHPLINGTLALWQFQGNLNDSSGLGNNLTAVSTSSYTPFPSAVLYAPVSTKVNGVTTNDGCLQAVDLFDTDYAGSVAPNLMAPLSSALQIAGAATWEWVMMQKGTFTGTYICCANPLGRSGGAAPDRIGSLYTLYWTTFSELAGFTDQHVGSNVPSNGYGTLPSCTIAAWAGTSLPQAGDWSAHHYACVRDSGNNWFFYRDGALLGTVPSTTSPNTAVGNEVTFIGRCETGANGGVGFFASMRIVNYARNATQIAADAAYVLGACGLTPSPPVTDPPPAGQPAQLDPVQAARIGSVFRYQPQGWTGWSNQQQTNPGLQV